MSDEAAGIKGILARIKRLDEEDENSRRLAMALRLRQSREALTILNNLREGPPA